MIKAQLIGLLMAVAQLSPAETMKVLVWNTERGANPYGPAGKAKVLEWIRKSDADVVLWQESYPVGDDNGPKLSAWVCEQLGWKVWQGESPHLAVASRYQQVETYFHHPWHGLAARLRDDSGREFLAWSIWLDYRSSPQSLAITNPQATDAELLEADTKHSKRFEQAQALLDQLDRLGHLSESVPVLVGGDWNTSSHLDWTTETAKLFPWRRPLALPVSRLMHAAGFADGFRVVNPKPVEAPGNTWTPRKDPTNRDDPPERIDRLYLRNPLGGQALVPIETTIYPIDPADARMPREEAIFPSDHAAVLIELEWRETQSSTPGAFLPEPGAASPGLDHQAPRAIEPGTTLTRIAWGSCFREAKPCPALDRLVDLKPELYLALGDNIYGDTHDMGALRQTYRRLARQPGWQALVKGGTRVMATWDDHDYGTNDAGSSYAPRAASKEVFLDFFDEPVGSARRQRNGIFTSSLMGPEGRRVQLIMLDLRTFRSDLARSKTSAYPEIARYRPLREDETQIMLGEDQWKWLEAELQKPADLRLIGLSTQLGASHNGFETWANLPAERERFFQLLEKTRAEGVMLLSGDTHWAEFSLEDRPSLYPIYDLTSSGLNQGWKQAGANTQRIGKPYIKANAGLLEIDWDNAIVRARIIDDAGTDQLRIDVRLHQLRFSNTPSPILDPSGTWQSKFGEWVLHKTADGWKAAYPDGSCELKMQNGVLVGRWQEGSRGGDCEFHPTRCGRFLQGRYGRGDGPKALPWAVWRQDAQGVFFAP